MPSSPIHALFQHALALHRAGRLAEAETAYRQIMRADPRDYPSRCMLGRLRLEQGRAEEAVKVLEQAVKIDGKAAPGLSAYAVALLRLRKFPQAAAMCERALAAAPQDAANWRNLGDALRGQEKDEEAVAAYGKAISLDPRAAGPWAGRADAQFLLGRHAEALRDADQALARDRRNETALITRARALDAQERREEALEAYAQALAAIPDEALLLRNRGMLLATAGRYAEAIADYTAALRAWPEKAALLCLRASALTRLRRFEEALADCDAAIAIDKSASEPHFCRGVALDALGRDEESVAAYDRALALQTDKAAGLRALTNRSVVLVKLRRLKEAADGMAEVLSAEPDHLYAYGAYAHCKAFMCDWSARDELAEGLRQRILAAKSEISPGTALAYLDDPHFQFECAKVYMDLNFPGADPLYRGPAYAHDRIRIAYLSADLHDHATARLAVELFERHDRARFDVSAVSFGTNDGSALRRRCEAAFATFFDVRAASDDEILALMRRLEIGIAVDLKGFTAEARTAVFTRRPSPVQVNYLGFPGTLGGRFWDYVLADKGVAPMEMQPFFSERIVHLPHSYQPNDSRRASPAEAPARAACGLPERGFVFCCFNNNFKITPPVFDVWMRLLLAIDGAVLWLIDDNAYAFENLRKEASRRGVDPARLVFSARIDAEAHLARHAHADLFLDTLPYNAHTTASDALWMGVPVVTCSGRAFAGRVGASLCRAVGLAELVAADLAGYESIALSLARDPARLAAIKARLVADRLDHPLFDAAGYTRAVETAYAEMWRRHRAGEAPAPFAV